MLKATLNNLNNKGVNMIKSLYIPFEWVANKFEQLDHWLFTEEERAPIGFIHALIMNIVFSSIICLFIMKVVKVL